MFCAAIVCSTEVILFLLPSVVPRRLVQSLVVDVHQTMTPQLMVYLFFLSDVVYFNIRHFFFFFAWPLSPSLLTCIYLPIYIGG